MQMQIIRYNRVMFEMWLEKNQSRFLTVGIILLLLGLILLVLKRSNAFHDELKSERREFEMKNQSNVTLERSVITMQPGLREDRKISEYEKKKRFVSNVLFGIGAIMFLLFVCFIIFPALSVARGINSALVALFYPLIIVAGIEILLYLSNALICVLFDHVIEMCYANQYRIMRDLPVVMNNKILDSMEKEKAEDKTNGDETVNEEN